MKRPTLIEVVGFWIGLVKPIKTEDSEPFLIDLGRDKAFYRHFTLPSGAIYSQFKLL